MLPKKLRHNPGRLRAIVYAVLVHAVVIGLAVIGFRWTVQSPPGEVVQAVAVPETPAARKPEEPDRRAQEEEARQKAEAEKRRQDELKKQQEEEQAQQRLIAERKKKEAEEKERQKRAQEEARKKEEARRQEDTRRQKLAEEALKENLAAEEKARQQAAQSARAATAIDKYRALIRQRVSQSWNRPVGVAKGLKCVVNVRLAPGGKVLAARVVRSSGNAIFDRSVENAVYKAEPLPLPEDPTLFDNFREIEFLFSPEE